MKLEKRTSEVQNPVHADKSPHYNRPNWLSCESISAEQCMWTVQTLTFSVV